MTVKFLEIRRIDHLNDSLATLEIDKEIAEVLDRKVKGTEYLEDLIQRESDQNLIFRNKGILVDFSMD